MVKRLLLRCAGVVRDIWRTIARGMRYKQALREASPFRCTNFMARHIQRADR